MSQNNQTSNSTSYRTSNHPSNLEIMGNSPLGVVQEFPGAIVAAAAANSIKQTQHETAPTNPIPPNSSPTNDTATAEVVSKAKWQCYSYSKKCLRAPHNFWLPTTKYDEFKTKFPTCNANSIELDG